MLSNVDRELLQRCLNRSPGAWEDFINRYLGLVVHVVNDTAASRTLSVSTSVRDDLVSDVFFALVKKDFAVLRRFRGQSSLATYLTVVARRIVVRGLLQRRVATSREVTQLGHSDPADFSAQEKAAVGENREEIESALAKLTRQEAAVVRMYHLEGRTYREIGETVGMAENSVGPYLTRARAKMRGELTT